MKRVISVLAVLIAPLLAASNSSIYEQIKKVNTNWERIGVFTPELLNHKGIKNEKELIQTHLHFVIEFLEAQKHDLNKMQSDNRGRCIDILEKYCFKGIFPINNHHEHRQPYFIDDFNNYCAVGYLLKQTGFENVSERIHNEMNYAYLSQIPLTYIKTWADDYGFTIDELALIQPTYQPTMFCQDDTFFIGNNTATLCNIFSNDIFSPNANCPNIPNPSVTIIDSPSHGSFILTCLPIDTQFIYIPDSGYTGIDKMRYVMEYGYNTQCGASLDTAWVVFKILPQPGSYISFLPGDCNYDGFIDNTDVLFLARAIGDNGPARAQTSPCQTNYSSYWNINYFGKNDASSDADGNGVINSDDLDVLQNCFRRNEFEDNLYLNNGAYSLSVFPYDSLLAPDKRIQLHFSVVDDSGSIVPLKALVMRITDWSTNKINFFTTNPVILGESQIVLNYLNKPYSVMGYDSFNSANLLYTGVLPIVHDNSSSEHCIPIDTFSLTTMSIPADSISGNGYELFSMRHIYGLDAGNNIIPVKDYRVIFSVNTVNAVTEIANEEFSIYPNPTGDHLEIELPQMLSNSVKITVTNISGQMLQEQTISSAGKNKLDVSSLTAGLYFIQLQDEKQQWVKKFVKE